MSALLAYIRAYDTEDRPLVPAEWGYTIETDRWTTIYPLGREARPDIWLHARLMLRHPSFPARAVFVCTGPRVVLDRLAARIASDALVWTRTWLTLAALRADGTTIATQIKSAWPDERPRDASDQPIGTLVAHVRRMAGFDAESGEA